MKFSSVNLLPLALSASLCVGHVSLGDEPPQGNSPIRTDGVFRENVISEAKKCVVSIKTRIAYSAYNEQGTIFGTGVVLNKEK